MSCELMDVSIWDVDLLYMCVYVLVLGLCVPCCVALACHVFTCISVYLDLCVDFACLCPCVCMRDCGVSVIKEGGDEGRRYVCKMCVLIFESEEKRGKRRDRNAHDICMY
jgi:hypothetical protein